MKILLDFGRNDDFLFEESCFSYKDVLSEQQRELIENGLTITDGMLHFRNERIDFYHEEDQRCYEEMSRNRVTFTGHFSAFFSAYLFLMATLKTAPANTIGILTKQRILNKPSECIFNVTFLIKRSEHILDELLNDDTERSKELFGSSSPVFMACKPATSHAKEIQSLHPEHETIQ